VGVAAIVALLCVVSCGDDSAQSEPLFPANYAESYVEVRDCRASTEHDLSRIRVLADPATADAYEDRDQGFSKGSLLLKVEYEYADTTCSGDILRWTVMVRETEGSSPDTLDWRWQKVDAELKVVSDNEPRCVGCHTSCGMAPEGYLGTCTTE
jgi:hypothetical protein